MLILVMLYALHLCEVMNNEMFEGILQRPTMFWELRGVPIFSYEIIHNCKLIAITLMILLPTWELLDK